jgi:hypothetical protein
MPARVTRIGMMICVFWIGEVVQAKANECEQLGLAAGLVLALNVISLKLPQHLSPDDPVLKQVVDLTPGLFGGKKGRVTLNYFDSWEVNPVTFKRSRIYKRLSLFDTMSANPQGTYAGWQIFVPPLDDQFGKGLEPLVDFICLVEK